MRKLPQYLKSLEEAFLIAQTKVIALLDPHGGEITIKSLEKDLEKYQEEARATLDKIKEGKE